MSDAQENNNGELLNILKIISNEARYRQIVPFLGAGISISAGFPTIKLVAEYLAKVDFAIYFGVYEDRFPDLDDGHKAGDTYRQHPSKYLEDFGWPNIGQLNADIWAWLGRGINEDKIDNKEIKSYEEIKVFMSKYFKDSNCPMDEQLIPDLKVWLEGDINEKIKVKNDNAEIKSYEEIKNIKGEGRKKIWENDFKQYTKKFPDYSVTTLDYLANDITPFVDYLTPTFLTSDEGRFISNVGLDKQNRQLDFRDHVKAIVQWTLRKELAERESGTAQAMLDEWLRWKKYYFEDNPIEEPGLLHGDWEVLLDRLCEGNFNLADTLFTSFEQGLKPTLSHRYLAFLQPKLGIPLILTTNFDSFLEQAFQDEGIPPKIFDVHRDAELPHAPLVNRQLSLLKLHGSSYGLRLGERLKYPLETDACINALNYIPQNALILVMGFSGSERRIMQMLQAIAKDESLGSTNPRLIWIQGPGKASNFLNELMAIPGDSVETCKVKHIDSFLQELYFYIANSYQSSSSSYLTFPNTPRPQTLPFEIEPKNSEYKKEDKRRPVHLCISEKNESNKLSSSWATLAGMAFIQSLGYDYTVIWIDLENHHTVEGIIAEFFERVRIVDSKAPSCAISNPSRAPSRTVNNRGIIENEAIEKTVKRISEVFQRGRYVLVLDSVEAFARPQMVHHAIPSSYYELCDEFKIRITNLGGFLKKLLRVDEQGEDTKEHYYDSYVVVTIGEPHHRHGENSKEHLVNKQPHDGSTTDENPSMYKLVCENLIEPFKKNKVIDCKHIHVHSYIPDCYGNIKSPLSTNPTETLELHWGRKISHEVTRKISYDNSVSRARDALLLLEELRKTPSKCKSSGENNAETKKEITNPKAINAFICLLSMFRRPRPSPLLRSIIERWGLRTINDADVDDEDEVSVSTHLAIKNLLLSISTGKSSVGILSQNHEGGIVWLFREVHEATYEALTEFLHIQAWRDRGFDEEPEVVEPNSSKIGAVIDGILTITWHISIARTYYADVFLPTRDIRSFYEYLYHRVSATRIMTLLIDIIEKNIEDYVFWGELESCCQNIFFEDSVQTTKLGIKDLGDLTRYVQIIGIFEPIKWVPKKKLEQKEFLGQLKRLRVHALETLYMALERNKLFIRAVATPDTVLAWSKQFIGRELSYMWDGKGLDKLDQYDKEVRELNEKLEKLFEELEFKALLSKMQYKDIIINSLEKSKEEGKECISTADLEAFLLTATEKLKEGTRSDKQATEIDNPDDDDSFSEEVMNKLGTLLKITKCHVLSGDDNIQTRIRTIHEYTEQLIVKASNTDKSSDNRRWAKTQKREVLELSCIHHLYSKWPFWKILLEREESKARIKDDNLKEAEKASFQYEDMVRETAKTNDEDIKHRSSALTFRARALYLRGYFPQAHHFLDLASARLNSALLGHQTAISVVHIVRAEMLAISAHEHYFSGSKHDQVIIKIPKDDYVNDIKKKLLPIASSSMKKIERAEQELHCAEVLLRNMAHQNIWLIHMEFGWAQIKIERMLFEIEKLFWSWSKLDVSEYLRKSGELEQKILDGMRHLRNVLDAIPYQSWKTTEDEKKQWAEESLIEIERMVYQLWRQYFVIGAYYSSLLSSQYRQTIRFDEKTTVSDISRQIIPCLTGFAVAGKNAEKYRKRWKLWCTAMRFEIFGSKSNISSFTFVDVQTWQDSIFGVSDDISLRSAIIKAMRYECEKTKIDAMWNLRRSTKI